MMNPQKKGEYSFEGIDICFLYEPFYIGKGKGPRIKAHFYPSNLKIKNYKNNTIKNIISSGKKVITEILVNNITEENAYLLERKIINNIGRKNTKSGLLCNLTEGGLGILNCKIPSRQKQVFQYDLNRKLYKKWTSITEAAKQNNLYISDISKCCLNKARTHGGYFWSFSEIKKDFIKNKKNRNILQFELDNILVKKWESISQASKELNISHSYISRCCKGIINKVNNHYFRYEDNIFIYKEKKIYKKEVVLLIKNNNVYFDSVKDAAKYLDITTKSVINRCKSKKLYDDINLSYVTPKIKPKK